MDDPDAMWKPGYDGPPPVARATRELFDESPPGRSERVEPEHRARVDATEEPPAQDEAAGPRGRRTRRRIAGAGLVLVAVALVLVAIVVVLDDGSDEPATGEVPADSEGDPAADDAVATATVPVAPPDPSVFGGPAAQRLPDDVASLWSITRASNGDHWVEVVRRDLVVVATAESGGGSVAAASGPPATTLVALDAPTGAEQWTLRFDAEPREVRVVGAVDDVLVVERAGEAGPSVIGVDIVTGETRWTVDAAPNGGHVGLVGTSFVARLPSSSDRAVVLIDAVSGREVGSIVSDSMATDATDATATDLPRGWFTDRRGTWYVVDDGDVLGYDLRAELGEPTVVGSLGDELAPRLVVDDRIVAVDDSGSIALAGQSAGGTVNVAADVPEPVRTLTPVAGSNFVVTAPRAIAGATVEGNDVDLAWLRNEGVLVDDHPVEGGMLLQVATRGGAAMQLVDGLTGRTVEDVTMVPGGLAALAVAGDGVVVLRTSVLGVRLSGLDLGGSERWSLAGSSPVVVGDRIVVRAVTGDVAAPDSAPASGQLQITAYGDLE